MNLKVFCQNIKYQMFDGINNDLVVYYGKADSFINRIPDFYNFLSDYEKARADRFKLESVHNCYVCVHALLRIELSKLTGTKPESIKIEISKSGKPFTSEINIPFSLSRTNSLFAFVIGRENQFLGIDIERIKYEIDYISISRNYYSIKEQHFVLFFKENSDKTNAFFEIWTRKEALLKALGIGINTELRKVQVLEGGNQIDIAGVETREDSFMVATVLKDGAYISIASSIEFVPGFKELSLFQVQL
jgi:4'-phosphopantetheinyl transferase